MAAIVGWYGPLIDLSDAASHVGGYVQLLVFVHKSTPIQYKLSKGGAMIRTDIQVGDDTRPFFSVSIWQKQIGSMALQAVGSIVLLQNARISKFGNVLEARTVHCSSLLTLVYPYESLIAKGVDDLLRDCRVKLSSKEKLAKVITWLQQAGSTLCNVKLNSSQHNRQLNRNWKVLEERKPRDFFSLFEVSNLTQSCKATFYASIGEMFLPITWRSLAESEMEKMFISRRLNDISDNNLAEDLICFGCYLCGSPLDLDNGSIFEKNNIPLYCSSSSDRLHKKSLIYRPFMLYVWDETYYIPLLVTNKAAELLFGTIKAEKVHLCFIGPKHHSPKDALRFTTSSKPAKVTVANYCSLNADKPVCPKETDFYLIWLIMLKIMLRGKNSPMKFEVDVNVDLDRENGRFEMVSMSMPCLLHNSLTVKPEQHGS